MVLISQEISLRRPHGVDLAEKTGIASSVNSIKLQLNTRFNIPSRYERQWQRNTFYFSFFNANLPKIILVTCDIFVLLLFFVNTQQIGRSDQKEKLWFFLGRSFLKHLLTRLTALSTGFREFESVSFGGANRTMGVRFGVESGRFRNRECGREFQKKKKGRK